MFPVEEKVSNEAVLQALAGILSPAIKEAQQKVAASGTPSTPYLHGPGGLFGVSGLERDLIHTRIQGRGLSARLAIRASRFTNPLFGYITGFQDVTGTVADAVCDDPEVAGQMKTCIQTAPFGRISFMTREIEINRVGQLTDRGEFDDLQLLNDPIAPILGTSIFPQMSGRAATAAGAEVLARMLELGIAFSNRLGRRLYNGTPNNNSANDGYKEWMGLDILIGTTKVDALTGVDCTSLHSDIKDFNYECVENVNADPNIVEVLTMQHRFVRHIAVNTALDPVEWVFAMRTALFDQLVDVWPCTYMSYRCAVRDGTGIDPVPEFDTMAAIRMRDAMRNGRFLTIDGVRVEVVLDDFIVEESSSDTSSLDQGQFASDIYLVPLTIRGGRPATFWQHYDFRAGTMQAVVQGRLTNDFWTDGGMYLWNFDKNNWCVVWEAKIEPRIILRTPQIAGRLTNVCYSPLQHYRDVHPEDDYFTDGGVTSRDPPSLYEDWSGGS